MKIDNYDPDPHLEEIEQEAKVASDVVTRHTLQFLKTTDMISESYLAQVLTALWDSGIYEYVRRSGCVDMSKAAADLGLDADILGWLFEYLVGRGLMKPVGDLAGTFELTERGRTYWNYMTRGLLFNFVGGYNDLLIRLGPLLRKEIPFGDPSTQRSGRLVALGASYTQSGSGTVSWVMKELHRLGTGFILDLGCGAGHFLTQLALYWPGLRGVGVDMSEAAILEARIKAEDRHVSDRILFQTAKVSDEPMALDPAILEQVEVITAMYVLHEFGGRGGPEAVSRVIRSLRRQFPGRKLLMLEGTRANHMEMWSAPPRSLGQLDYSFIHPISGQGRLHTPDEWQQIVENAGARLLDRIAGFTLVPSWISMYIIGLD